MSIRLHGHFYRTISEKEIIQISQAETEAVLCTSLWSKVLDWFCGTDKILACKYIYRLTHEVTAQDKLDAFMALRELVKYELRDRFQLITLEVLNAPRLIIQVDSTSSYYLSIKEKNTYSMTDLFDESSNNKTEFFNVPLD